MTEKHGIGRRCENESTLFPEYFHRQFLRPKAQKLAMRLRRRLLAASQPKPNPKTTLSRQRKARLCLTTDRKRHFRTPHPKRTLML